MHNLGAAVTALVLLLLVAFMAPNILALNRGKILRNVAIWLAIFVALGLLYKNFGPGQSSTMQAWPFASPREGAPPPVVVMPAAPAGGPDNGNQGFTPPKE